MLFDRVFIYAWPCMQAQKLNLCACNQYSQQLSSVVVWIACLLAGWLTNKQIAERNKLLFTTLQQLD